MSDTETAFFPAPEDQAAVPHEISRSAFKLPLNSARLFHVVLSNLRPGDKKLPAVEMSVGDVVRALGLNDSKRSYQAIEQAVDGLMGQVLTKRTDSGRWKKFTFVSTAEFDPETQLLKVVVHDEMAPFLLDLKGMFTLVSNRDFGKITSEYGVRLFQILMSWSDQAGKAGNKPGCWFFQTTPEDLRRLVDVPPDAYQGPQGTSNFLKAVVVKPVEEINGLPLGLHIAVEKSYRSRSLVGIRFNCTKTDKCKDVTPKLSPAEKAQERMRATAEWKEIFAHFQAQPFLPQKGMPMADEDTKRDYDLADADKEYMRRRGKA